MEFLYASYTDIGGRRNNEDSFYADESENGIILVVADGLGGDDSGEIASSLAVEAVKNCFYNSGIFNIEKAVCYANTAILKKQEETGLKMKTTISVAVIKKNTTTFANVGDSRIYAFKESSVVFQSVDHSVARLAAAVGEIDISNLRCHPDRNLLTRALGVDKSIKIDITEINNEEYDSLLLCTDGFWEYVFEKEMIKCRTITQNPDIWIFRMQELLRQRIPENNDNNTAVALIKKGD